MTYKQAVALVLDATSNYIDDWETGIADGTYESDTRDELEELRAAWVVVKQGNLT